MRQMYQRILSTRGVALVLALGLLVTACAGEEDETASDGGETASDDGGETASDDGGETASDEGGGETVQVGVVDSLTGATAVAGQANVCGFKLAQQVIQDEGIAGNRTIELAIRDDESTPAVAAERATELTQEGIDLFVGGSTSGTVLAIIPILNDAGALHTGGTSQSTEVIAEGDRVVRVNSNSIAGAELYGEHISENYESIVFVALEGAYGEGAVTGVKDELDDDVEVLDEIYVPGDTTDYQTVITTIAGLDPDVVAWYLFGNEQPVGFMRNFQQADLDTVALAGAGVLSESLAQAAEGAAEGVVGFDVYSKFAENEENQRLVAAFEEHSDSISECSGKPLDKQVGVSYTQLLLVAKAMAETGSTDPGELYDGIVGNEFALPTGEVTFDDSGQAEVNWYEVVGTSDGIEPAE